VAADVEQEAVMLDRAADAAHLARVGFEDEDLESGFRERVGRRQPGRTGPDNDVSAWPLIVWFRKASVQCPRGVPER
jgi:hypothetical protein